MWPDQVSNPGPLTYESGVLPTALHGPALEMEEIYICLLTYSVNIANGTVWEIIVNDEINSLEINTSAHQLCTYQDPDLSRPKTLYHIISLQ